MTRRDYVLALAFLALVPLALAVTPPMPMVEIRIPLGTEGDEIMYWLYEDLTRFDGRVSNPIGSARRGKITPAESRQAAELLASLPKGPNEVPAVDKVLVRRYVSRGTGVVEVEHVYHRKRLPSQLKQLIVLLGGLRPELQGTVEFSSNKTSGGDVQ